MQDIMQVVFYIVSPVITLMAVFVAYLTLNKQSMPQLLIHYRPNPDIQTLIDLVVENIGGGLARDVIFSQPLPAKCFGVESAQDKGIGILGEGLPAISSGQKYIFNGGQYAGLFEVIGEKLEVVVSYSYKNPIGLSKTREELCILSVSHLRSMPTRTSAEQAIVDALKGPNKTTLQRIEDNLRAIGDELNAINNKIE